MKHFLSFLLVLCALSANAQVKMMAFSDPHVLDKSLFTSSDDFSSYSYLVEYSQDLFDRAVTIVEEAAPDVLIIPGDLTLNGDSVSHKHVAAKLNGLVQKGIQVIVIPGNHDINEPNAKSYTAVETGSVTVEQFCSLYAACGYDKAEEIAADGLSYLYYANDRTAFVCMNSSLDNTSGHQSAGGLTEATLAWAEAAAAKAIASGRYPIGVTHHQLVEHFDNQASLDTDHIANLGKTLHTPSLAAVQKRLVDAGLTTVLTGHMHIMSTKDVTPAGSTRALVDVSTNALCGYKGAIRSMRFVPESATIDQMTVVDLGDITGLTAAERDNKAAARNNNLFTILVNKVNSMMQEKLGNGAAMIGTMLENSLRKNYTQMFCYLTAGNEYADPAAAEALASACVKDYTDLCSLVLLVAPMKGLDAATLSTYMAQAEDVLYPTVYSIMYNALGATKAGVAPELINQVPDWDPTIVFPYTVDVMTAMEQVEAMAAPMGVYDIMGRYCGTSTSALPSGVYIVNGQKLIR